MSNFHTFFNTNYICGKWDRNIGIYYYHRYLRHKNIDCFVIRVPINNKTITSYKATTKEDAIKIFNERMPNWQGPIPYFETISKRFKK